MPAIDVTDLVARARVESGLRNNQYWNDDKIVEALSAGGSELWDLFTVENQKYAIAEFDFTVTGPADALVTLPDDFQQGHSLEIYPQFIDGVYQAGQRARTIRYLSNWLNRNEAGGVNGVFVGTRDPVYAIVDNKIRFYPPEAVTAAPYKLYYTPQWTTLALPVTVSWVPVASANAADESGSIQYNFGSSTGDHPAFLDAMLGGSLTVAFMEPNADWNCTAKTILGPDPFSFGNSALTDQPWPGGSFTNPVTDATASITYQPANTRSTLPSMMGPWSEYLVVYAAIQINIDRQRDTSTLETKLERLKARVINTLAIREEEPQQPPLTRGGSGGWDGFGGNW